MTIRKGSEWGTPGQLPADAAIAASNGDLHRLVNDTGFQGRVIGVTGGDLFRSLGGESVANRLHTDEAMAFPVDVVEVVLDGQRSVRFVSHLIGHDLSWRVAVAAMNVDLWRQYRLGPHAHPGDGVVDVYSAALAWGDITRVAPRAKNGSHVPHPRIGLKRAEQVSIILPKQLALRADDIRCGRARTLVFTVIPDAITVVL